MIYMYNEKYLFFKVKALENTNYHKIICFWYSLCINDLFTFYLRLFSSTQDFYSLSWNDFEYVYNEQGWRYWLHHTIHT